MYPTLQNDEMGISNIIQKNFDEIERFDIVIVEYEMEHKSLAKRVIGLPGETIQYRDDVLYINGTALKESFLETEYVKEYKEKNNINFTKDYGPITLKSNEYFLCGDNRPVSKDSRMLGAFNYRKILSIGFYKI